MTATLQTTTVGNNQTCHVNIIRQLPLVLIHIHASTVNFHFLAARLALFSTFMLPFLRSREPGEGNPTVRVITLPLNKPVLLLKYAAGFMEYWPVSLVLRLA